MVALLHLAITIEDRNTKLAGRCRRTSHWWATVDLSRGLRRLRSTIVPKRIVDSWQNDSLATRRDYKTQKGRIFKNGRRLFKFMMCSLILIEILSMILQVNATKQPKILCGCADSQRLRALLELLYHKSQNLSTTSRTQYPNFHIAPQATCGVNLSADFLSSKITARVSALSVTSQKSNRLETQTTQRANKNNSNQNPKFKDRQTTQQTRVLTFLKLTWNKWQIETIAKSKNPGSKCNRKTWTEMIVVIASQIDTENNAHTYKN